MVAGRFSLAQAKINDDGYEWSLFSLVATVMLISCALERALARCGATGRSMRGRRRDMPDLGLGVSMTAAIPGIAAAPALHCPPTMRN